MADKKIYESINKIQAALAKSGIAKGRKNQQQGYAFRGIDDVYAALAPLLAEHGVCIFPRATERDCVERQTSRGGVLFYVTVRVEFDFVSSIDGSTHTCVTYGEAMDSADKATNKAMSAAYKYACLQTFCIPTEGDNDADATTHDVSAARPATKPRPAPKATQPTNEQTLSQIVGDEIPFTEPKVRAPGPDDWMTINAFQGEADRCTDLTALSTLLKTQRTNPHLDEMVQICTARKQEILNNLQAGGTNVQ